MANPSTRWDRIPVFGAWQTDDGAAASGSDTVIVPADIGITQAFSGLLSPSRVGKVVSALTSLGVIPAVGKES